MNVVDVMVLAVNLLTIVAGSCALAYKYARCIDLWMAL